MNNTKSLFIAQLFRRGIYSFFIVLAILAKVSAQPYQAIKVKDLTENSDNANWLTPSLIPNNQKKYLLANEQGQINFFSPSLQENQNLIELSNYFDSDDFIKLTAIAAHPSFSLREQSGTGKIFTAHLERYNQTKKVKRLQVRDDSVDNQYDLVLTQWQLNPVTRKSIDPSSKREILRVSAPSKAHKIKQLTFNPYAQTWDDNYGLLHIVVANDGGNAKQPLLSGMVLRINPEKFGLKQYTIPPDNPFIKNKDISDEIALLGMGEIHKLIWQKRNTSQLIVNHQVDKRLAISIAQLGDDWRNKKNKYLVWQAPINQKLSLASLYSGKSLKELRNQLLFFSREAEQPWQLNAIALDKLTKENLSPEILWTVTNKNITPSADIELYQDPQGELAIYNRSQQVIFEIISAQLEQKSTKLSTAEVSFDDVEDNNSLLYILLALIAILAIGYKLKFSPADKHKAPHLYKTFARFELSESNQTITFYDRHRKSVSCQVSLKNIVSSEVKLNNMTINTISGENGHGFDQSIESDLLHTFNLEQRIKMVDDKIRHIDIVLTDNNNKSYSVCLYYRQGNQRLTKIKYERVLEQCMDWCWFIAEQLNEAQTGHRNSQQEQQSVNSTITPAIANVPIQNQPIEPHETSASDKAITPNPTTIYCETDTEIIDALDKLANLKQQGFLNESEFELAKIKLLQDLIDK